jgi:cytosine/adenosine deaminase-related metal-dependent hydrolase
MFTQMRCAFGCERARINAVTWEADVGAPENMLTARQMLEMATRNGAHVVGLEDRIGSLTPGKQADVVVIDAGALNVAPVIDPVAAVTLCADVSNVDTVIVGGKVRKRDGKLLADVDSARRLVQASSDYLVEEAARRAAAKQEA